MSAVFIVLILSMAAKRLPFPFDCCKKYLKDQIRHVRNEDQIHTKIAIYARIRLTATFKTSLFCTHSFQYFKLDPVYIQSYISSFSQKFLSHKNGRDNFRSKRNTWNNRFPQEKLPQARPFLSRDRLEGA